MIDPIPDLLNDDGTSVVTDPVSLSTLGIQASGIAMESAARAVLRVYASAAGDQLTLSLQDDGQPNLNGLPFPFGQLQTLLPQDGSVTATQITVTAVSTPAGPMGFALYLPSQDFSRGGADDSASSRPIKINVQSIANGSMVPPFNSNGVRPPVILVHGLWGTQDTWTGFAFDPQTGQVQNPSVGQFWTAKVDYSASTKGTITNIQPNYPGLIDESSIPQSALGFQYNAPIVLQQIVEKKIPSFRTQFNHIVVAQADIVAHSMGGDIMRTAAQLNVFTTAPSYKKGPVNKLVTIGTPHLGSPVATALMQGITGSNGPLFANQCFLNVLAAENNMSILTAKSSGQFVTGAVGDLQGCPDPNSSANTCLNNLGGVITDALRGPVPSHAIQNLNPVGYSGPMLPTAVIAGQMGTNNPGIGGNIGLQVCNTSPLALNLTATLWPTVFNNLPSDGIVSVVSQSNNLTPFYVGNDDIHTGVLTKMGFFGTDELSDQPLAAQVRLLLNTTRSNSAFVLLP